MDPVTALTGILAAGAAAAGKEVAGQAVKDLYAALKAALSRLVSRPKALEELEAAPDAEGSRAEVTEELNKAALTPEISELATQLAGALAELDNQSLERAGIEIGAVRAAQNAIIRDLDAAGGIRIDSVTADQGDAVITGLTAGGGQTKK